MLLGAPSMDTVNLAQASCGTAVLQTGNTVRLCRQEGHSQLSASRSLLDWRTMPFVVLNDENVKLNSICSMFHGTLRRTFVPCQCPRGCVSCHMRQVCVLTSHPHRSCDAQRDREVLVRRICAPPRTSTFPAAPWALGTTCRMQQRRPRVCPGQTPAGLMVRSCSLRRRWQVEHSRCTTWHAHLTSRNHEGVPWAGARVDAGTTAD